MATRTREIDANEFAHGVGVMCKTFSRSDKLNIVWCGTDIKTDGNTIYLPTLDATKSIPEDKAEVFRGMTLHEGVGHVLHTDNKAWVEFGKKYGPIAMYILNCIEDVWIEKKVISLYVGARSCLEATAQWVLDQNGECYKKEYWSNRAECLPLLTAYAGRKEVLGYGVDAIDKIKSLVDPGLWADATKYGKLAAGCNSTTEAIAVAKKMMADLKHSMAKAPEPTEPGKSPPEPGDEGVPGGKGKPEPDKSGEKGKGGDKSKDKGEPGDKGDKGEPGEDPSKDPGEDPSEDPGAEGAGAEGEKDSETSPSSDGLGEESFSDKAPDADGATQEDLRDDGSWRSDDELEGKPSGSGANFKDGYVHQDEGGKGGVTDEDWLDDGVFDMGALTPKEVKGSAKDLLDGIIPSASTVISYAPLTTAMDKVHTKHDEPEKYGRYTYGKDMKPTPHGDASYERIRANINGHVGVVQRHLERAIMSRDVVDRNGGYESGRLDPKAFPSVISRLNNGAFWQLEEGVEINSAVSLLIDLSGSMAGDKVVLATQATVCLAEALSRVNIPFEVIGFHSVSGRIGSGAAASQASFDKLMNAYKDMGVNGTFRAEPLDLHVYKEFDEPLRVCRTAISTMINGAGGNNVDGESLEFAYERLRARKEEKKLLIVLSDGQPACGIVYFGSVRDPRAAKKHLSVITRRIEEDRSVFLYGIGIMSDAVKEYYSNKCVIKAPNELPEAAMHIVQTAIMGVRRVVHAKVA